MTPTLNIADYAWQVNSGVARIVNEHTNYIGPAPKRGSVMYENLALIDANIFHTTAPDNTYPGWVWEDEPVNQYALTDDGKSLWHNCNNIGLEWLKEKGYFIRQALTLRKELTQAPGEWGKGLYEEVWQWLEKESGNYKDEKPENISYYIDFLDYQKHGAFFHDIDTRRIWRLLSVPRVSVVPEAVPTSEIEQFQEQYIVVTVGGELVLNRAMNIKEAESIANKNQFGSYFAVPLKQHIDSLLTWYKPWREEVDYQSQLTAAEARIKELEAQVENLKAALRQDKTGLAKGLSDVRQWAEGFSWIKDGRGPYAWDDDRYKEEVFNIINGVSEIAIKSLRESGALATKAVNGLFKPQED